MDVQALTNTDVSCSKLFNANSFTEHFNACIVNSITVWTDTIPSQQQFPFINLEPGWINGDSHPTQLIQARATNINVRARARYIYPSRMREPWSKNFKLCTIATNSSKVVFHVAAVFM